MNITAGLTCQSIVTEQSESGQPIATKKSKLKDFGKKWVRVIDCWEDVLIVLESGYEIHQDSGKIPVPLGLDEESKKVEYSRFV